MEGIFFQDPGHPLEIPIKLHTYSIFTLFGLIEPPIPKEIPIPSVERVWIFSGTEHLVKSMDTKCC